MLDGDHKIMKGNGTYLIICVCFCSVDVSLLDVTPAPLSSCCFCHKKTLLGVVYRLLIRLLILISCLFLFHVLDNISALFLRLGRGEWGVS